MYLKDELQREFYLEICANERWSGRQLQERINSMLFERTAISKKPDELIRIELQQLRDENKPALMDMRKRSQPLARTCNLHLLMVDGGFVIPTISLNKVFSLPRFAPIIGSSWCQFAIGTI